MDGENIILQMRSRPGHKKYKKYGYEMTGKKHKQPFNLSIIYEEKWKEYRITVKAQGSALFGRQALCQSK